MKINFLSIILILILTTVSCYIENPGNQDDGRTGISLTFPEKISRDKELPSDIYYVLDIFLLGNEFIQEDKHDYDPGEWLYYNQVEVGTENIITADIPFNLLLENITPREEYYILILYSEYLDGEPYEDRDVYILKNEEPFTVVKDKITYVELSTTADIADL